MNNSQAHPLRKELEKLINWGLIAKQEEGDQTLYIMHTLVRDYATEELKKEALDRKQLLKRAGKYYENIATIRKNIWDILKARENYYEAEEWGKADDIINNTWTYLLRWGYIELAMNLLNQSIDTIKGTKRAVTSAKLATIYTKLGDWKTSFKMYTEV